MERERGILKNDPSKHGAVVTPFIIDAFKEGAHRIKPKHILQDQWFRQIMIGVVYNDIGSTATLEELAEKHGVFKQSIAASNKSFLTNLWNNGSLMLQDRYPLNEVLTARKPRSQRSRERFSEIQGGTSLRIKEQVESGVTDRNKISKNTGIPKKVISVLASTTLKDWGVNISRKLAPYREVLAQLDKETDDKKIQELLDRISYHVIRYDLARKREASQFSPLSPLIGEAGFSSRDNHLFATSLKNAGVPIARKDIVVEGARRQNFFTSYYYIVLSRHKNRAIQVFKEDQSLQRFQR